jgi:hypothetical protein
VVFHTINCCGTHVALGISATDATRFDVAEALCDSMYPACGCASGITTAEDGGSSWNLLDFAAECAAGSCRSVVE